MAERERFIYSSSEQMLSAVGVWMERCRDGEGELRDLKDLDGEEVVGVGVVVRVWLEKKFSKPPHPHLISLTPFTTTSPLLFFFFLFCEPQRKARSEEGPPPTKTKAKQKT